MECFVCSKPLSVGYLCEEHAKVLKERLELGEGIVEAVDQRYHCLICGEHENRIIIEYPDCGYFCDIDICEEYSRYIFTTGI